VRTFCLCLVLMFAVPALATISQVQSNATWNTSGGSCSVNLTNTVRRVAHPFHKANLNHI